MPKIYVPQSEDPLTIDSDFEGGSIGHVMRLGENYYFLELRPDTTYQFSIRLRHCKGRKVVISFRCRDYKPSHADLNGGNRHWRWPDGLVKPVVSGDRKHWKEVDSFTNDRSTYDDLYTIVHTFDTDTAYVASAEPYLYSDLLAYLDTLPDDPRVKRSVFGLSRNKIEQPLLTISGNPDSRKAVLIISREDADEFTGSYALEGLVNHLISHAPECDAALKRFTFYIAPMVGVDGVIAGSYHSAGYGYGGSLFHLDDPPEEIANVKKLAHSIVDGGSELVLAGKLHGKWSMALDPFVNPVDFLTASPKLLKTLYECATPDWRPTVWSKSLTIRPQGFFERFIVDDFGLMDVFGCHASGHSYEQLRNLGRDLLKALLKFLENK